MSDFVFGSHSTLEKRVELQRDRTHGVRHRHRLEPQAPRPGEEPILTVTVTLDRAVDRVVCRMQQPEAAELPLAFVGAEWDLLNWSYYQVWQLRLPARPSDTLVRYQILAYPSDGSAPISADDGATFSYLVAEHQPPPWAGEAVIYQIFPDRFYPGQGRVWQEAASLEDFHGGALRGIVDQLDYVADLGFNCLWLNPFFPDHTYHGYHATDYFQVNPRLGTLEDARNLVDEAHRRGIRLLLDFVANHWGSGHETFQAARKHRGSEFHGWYHWRRWPDEYETFFGVKDLPQLNVDHPGVRDYLFRSARFWLEDVGFDGLRLDYVLGPSHDFWTEFRSVVKAVKPDAWIFGEAVDTPESLLTYQGRFDGCLDFLLTQTLRQTFASGSMDVAAFDAFLNQHETYFPVEFGRPSFLDNHDMDRFLLVAGGDKRRLKAAALCQFTLAGPPIIYYGTEVGLGQNYSMQDARGQGMGEVRQPMVWGDEQDGDLRAYFRQLIHFRRAHPLLWQGQRQTLHVDAAAGTYAYRRYDADGRGESIVVALNLSAQARTIRLSEPQTGQAITFELAPLSGDVAVLNGI